MHRIYHTPFDDESHSWREQYLLQLRCVKCEGNNKTKYTITLSHFFIVQGEDVPPFRMRSSSMCQLERL